MTNKNPDLKILVIIPKYNLTTDKFYKYLFPPSFGYIIAMLKHYDYKVDCLNLNHTEGKIEDVISNYLSGKKYDYIMTGGMALDYHCLRIIFDIINGKAITILGGMIITTEPELIYNEFKPDYGVIGEGEETIIELLDAIENKKDITKVTGLIFSV